MLRRQEEIIAQDLEKKMVILSGPRQVGKTTLARNLRQKYPKSSYLNYDEQSDQRTFLDASWDRRNDLIIFDEIHKHRKWKNQIKGVYDKEGIPPRVLITGSARMDFQRKSGDALTGRYFSHRLYPLSVAELRGEMAPDDALNQLLSLGGFPEPFLSGSEIDSQRWRKNYLDRVLREEIRDITEVKNIRLLTLMVELLRDRVGSPFSANSMARDLQVAPQTIQKWIQILEGLFIVFRVTPYHRNISRALLKEPKIYFYDTGLVRQNEGAVFENLAALSLLKHLHYLEDVSGEETSLHYIRDKEKHEVDFLVLRSSQKPLMIEAKYSETEVSKSLKYFHQRLPEFEARQIVCKMEQARQYGQILVEPATEFLNSLAN